MSRLPNVLLIMSDQEQHWSLLPSEIEFPAKERLLSRGVGFQKHYVNTVPCGPSRSVIYTGQHTQHTGVIANPHSGSAVALSPAVRTLGQLLMDRGYYTGYKGKWHLSNIDETSFNSFSDTRAALQSYGFNDFNFDGDYHGRAWAGHTMDRVTAASACSWISDASREAPWFLAVNFVNPHDVMFADVTGAMQSSRLMPKAVSLVLPPPGHPVYDKFWDVELPSTFVQPESSLPTAQKIWRRRSEDMLGVLPRHDTEAWRRYRSYYFNCIRDMDMSVNLVLDALERSSHNTDTIVIYTSDHGEMAGAQGLRQKGPCTYREAVNVPLIICHPDVASGGSTDALSSAIDLVPTVLGLVGLDKQHAADDGDRKGVDLSPAVVSCGARTERDDRGILFNYGVNQLWDPDRQRAKVRALRGNPQPEDVLTLRRDPDLSHRTLMRGTYDGRYKFARYFSPLEHHLPTGLPDLLGKNDVQLFDTHRDPDEAIDLSHERDSGPVLERLSAQTNNLIRLEIGVDDGDEYRSRE